jgi:ABC-type nitrate/sulfonate/bicarbonate transport system permease component
MSKHVKSGLEHVIGVTPVRVKAGLQFIVVIIVLALFNQIMVEYILPVWYKRGLASTVEIWNTAIAAQNLLLGSWQASLGHILLGLIGAIPGYVLGVYLSAYRRFEPAIMLMIGMLICYPKLAVSVILGFVVLSDELAIILFGWWVSVIYAMAVGFFTGRQIVSGSHVAIHSDMLDLAVLHLPTRSKFFWCFLLPHTIRELPTALMLSSAAICASLIFTESRVGGPGLGYEAYYVVTNSQNIPLFHVAALLIGVTNFIFWAILNGIRLRYWSYVDQIIARGIDWKLGRRRYRL